MKVYVEPPQNLSHAMFRVSRALKTYAPPGLQFVKHAHEADLQVLHVVGAEDLLKTISQTKSYAVIQYCYKSAGGSIEFWDSVWRSAELVWSYYDLCTVPAKRFYYAPLGVEKDIFSLAEPPIPRNTVFSSGYVSGPSAEAIEEVADAALGSGLSVYHLGPRLVQGMASRTERSWHAETGISDAHLARVLRACRWASGLRQVEGFELSVLEGFACGARPIVFERPDMLAWYRDFAVFVPPTHGLPLTEHLKGVFSTLPAPISDGERTRVLQRFDWKTIVEGFWEALLA